MGSNLMISRKQLANSIRALAIDGVERAKSGHPGMPMGMADIAEVLWNDYLVHNPMNPNWTNRDRFILSNGHGCMLQYALLHLTGYDLSIDDLKAFRQFQSRTPGHPEYAHTPGVEATTGPLGQGLAMGVGMAIAEKHLAAEFNQANFNLVDHYTYVFVGDGCLMEGISHEVCSLAGTLGLGKLIVFYDDNKISIDGNVATWFSDNTPERFKAYGWQVIANINGHDADVIKTAIEDAKKDLSHPTLICCKTQIGYGSPNFAGSEKTHGSPLGETEANLAKKNLDWHYAPFEIPAEYYEAWNARDKGLNSELLWNDVFAQFERKNPEKAAEFLRRTQNYLPGNFKQKSLEIISQFQLDKKPIATRKTSQACLEKFSEILPEMFGGSADLSESNGLHFKNIPAFTHDNTSGKFLHYGVREFGMSAIMNGIALHKGLIPFGGTFLTFVDYARSAVRMSALMQAKVIYVYSHDSIGLGEDGPTHQPIEHVAMLRMTPGLETWRPCDAVETVVAWQQMLERNGPSIILLTRQNVAPQNQANINFISRGAYVVFEPNTDVDAIIIATGSEVELAVKAAEALFADGVCVRVVSMPCAERFKKQDKDYQELILPKSIPARLAIEAGVSDYWYQFVGDAGKIIGIDTFGASAPADDLWKAYGFTVDNIKQQLQLLLTGVINHD